MENLDQEHGGVLSSDEVSTPSTPSIYAYAPDCWSDEDARYEGELTLLTLGGKEERIRFDHESSYGWLLHSAKEFWNKNTCCSVLARVDDIQIGFRINGKVFCIRTQGETSRRQEYKIYKDFKEQVDSVQCTVIRMEARGSPDDSDGASSHIVTR